MTRFVSWSPRAQARWFLAILTLALAALVAVAATDRPTALAQSATQPAGISVVGEGIVLVQPSVARIVVGVEVFNASLTSAQAEASRRMDAVVQRVKADGIPDADIKTVSYSIDPVYDFRDGQTTLRGYQVQNLVDVKSGSPTSLGGLIDGVVGAGATRIFSIRFESDDLSRLKVQARDLAMQNARSKADQMARAAGVSVGRPIFIQESDTGSVRPVQAEAAPMPAGLAAAPAARTPVQPGELEVRTQVHVVWAIQ